MQLMMVLSDLGIPRDIRHVSGNGVHTYRFINAEGKSTLFKWYWLPTLGHRALVYDEVQKLAGKNNNFQRVDLYNNIGAGNFPEWEFAVQLFEDVSSIGIMPRTHFAYWTRTALSCGKVRVNHFNKHRYMLTQTCRI
jgi:catalase